MSPVCNLLCPLQEDQEPPHAILADNLADEIREGARAGVKPSQVVQVLLPRVEQLLQVSGNTVHWCFVRASKGCL